MSSQVSIVIPNKNGEKYLRHTLESIRLQSLLPTEVVISDNFSIDNSLKILEDFKDLPMRVISPSREMTMSEHWNFAIQNVNSEWFFLLSNDDLLRSNAVRTLHRDLKNVTEKIAVISYRSEIINQDNKLRIGKISFGFKKKKYGRDYILKNLWFSHVNVAALAIKKSSWINVGKFPEEYEYLHDLVFFQNVSLINEIIFSPRVLGRYRIYENLKPSHERILKTNIDFEKLKIVQIPKLLAIYPELHVGTLEEGNLYSGSRLKNIIHEFVLYTMTIVRKSFDFLSWSGFPRT